ncbi:MAG TPA: hypothetical protein PLJ26_01170 [Candidatus Omnitrophota bacterium]|nr:hypothetical protein [Candidatus Omnitrophota bacterium]HQJ15086.1 hypothetical protein [Candidatus Omnitrophota bacterium]
MRLFRIAVLTGCALIALVCPRRVTFCRGQDIAEHKDLRKAQEFYKSGQRYMLEGDFAAANEEFMKAEIVLRTAPEMPLPEEDAQPYSSAARSPVKTAPQGLPLDPDIYYNLGVGALQKGDFIQAEAAFLRVVELTPLDKDACYNLGVLYEKYLNKPQEAVRFYTRYINLSDAKDTDVEQVRAWIADIKERMKR